MTQIIVCLCPIAILSAFKVTSSEFQFIKLNFLLTHSLTLTHSLANPNHSEKHTSMTIDAIDLNFL